MYDVDLIARANFWSDGRKCVTIPAFLRDQAADYFKSLDDYLKENYRSVCDSIRESLSQKSYSHCTTQTCINTNVQRLKLLTTLQHI